MNFRIAVLTAITLVAFSLNSILCRAALSGHLIDAESFTAIRLVAGAATLAALSFALIRRRPFGNGSWTSGALLFVYAAGFSFAYLKLPAGTGGLILFGSVQFSMIGVALAKGDCVRQIEWLGLAVALAGLIILVSPGLHAPTPTAAGLMALAGIAWGLYSLRGRSAKEPILGTADNFLKSVPFALLLLVLTVPHGRPTANGILLAVVSGAMTSAVGYVLWYSVLVHISAVKAAICQLAVPALVTIIGVLFLGEVLHPRLVIAAALMLGGVATAVVSRQAKASTQ